MTARVFGCHRLDSAEDPAVLLPLLRYQWKHQRGEKGASCFSTTMKVALTLKTPEKRSQGHTGCLGHTMRTTVWFCFLIYFFIFIFIFGCVGSLLLRAGFL